MRRPKQYDLTLSGIKHNLDADNVWEHFVGNQVPSEFVYMSIRQSPENFPVWLTKVKEKDILKQVPEAVVEKSVENYLDSDLFCIARKEEDCPTTQSGVWIHPSDKTDIKDALVEMILRGKQ